MGLESSAQRVHSLKMPGGEVRTAIQELASEGPHLISADTSKTLEGRLNLGKKNRSPARAAQTITENTFSYLRDHDLKTYGLLHEWLSETYSEEPTDEAVEMQDSASMGIGIVLTAFAIQYGAGFFDKLAAVSVDTKELAFPILDRKDRSIMGRVERIPVIEPFQTYLGGVIDRLEDYISYHNDFKEGASAAYNMVRSAWDEMSLDKQTPIV